MSKELSAVDLAAALQAMGLDVPAELAAKVENSVADRAEEYIVDRLSETAENKRVASAERWRKSLFGLAEKFAAEFDGQEKNVGQGRVFERFVEIETPSGKFAVRLREPREKK